jgi:hypothetical protein
LFFVNPDAIADAMGLVSALVVEKELEDARAGEKAEVSAVDYNRKADGPYKAECIKASLSLRLSRKILPVSLESFVNSIRSIIQWRITLLI